MVNNPECVNCFEEFSWTPAYSDGDAYCCDGCVMGGPCICTYNGPPPRLNIEEILGPENLSATTECANCFEEFRRPPVSYNGRMYCCEGCAHGGPCICTYDISPSGSEGRETPGIASGASLFEQTPKTSPAEPEPTKKMNRLWKASVQNPEPSHTNQATPRKANRFWGSQEPSDSKAQTTVGSESSDTDQGSSQTSLTPWVSELELEHDFEDAPIYTKFQLTVSPLIEMADVSLFTTQLESISAIENVALTRFDGDRATFEVETTVVKDVVKGVMNVSHFRVQSLRMTPDGLDLLLKTTGADADEEQPQDMVITLTANDSEEHDIHPVPRRRLAEQEAIARIDDEGELHTFKFEMGVDVFFNGRHQVEIGGVKGPVHMHSWRVQAILVGESADEAGSIMGTSQVREVITAFVTPFNETLLNKMPPFDEIMPTANNMARVIYDHLAGELEGQAVRVKSIRLWESPTSYVEYSGTGSSAF
ncbi:MAG: 6-carboxytetrahydropterin synthase [Chloroflexi bacterium]|nr:6-carboxytetrahydropterin synthase [Chloroflexota bacterium]